MSKSSKSQRQPAGAPDWTCRWEPSSRIGPVDRLRRNYNGLLYERRFLRLVRHAMRILAETIQVVPNLGQSIVDQSVGNILKAHGIEPRFC